MNRVAAHDEWSPDVEREPNGERLVWIEDLWANRLAAMRGPGESYSDTAAG